MPKTSKTKAKEEPKEEKNKKVVVVEEVENTEEETQETKETQNTEEPKEKETQPPEEETKEDSSKDEDLKDEKKDESEVSEETDDTNEEKPSTGKLLWIIIPTTLLVGALAGGVITYFSGASGTVNTGPTSPTPTPHAVESPTPQPQKELERADLKIQILNGSGVAGAAGSAKSFMEDLGYENIEVGNASSSDYEKTEISVKESAKEYSALVKNDLKDEYTLDSSIGTLPDSSSYDVVITLGS